MPCGCPAPPPHRRPSPSCSPRSRSTTTAAPATTSFRPGSSCLPQSANPPRPAARAIRELQGCLNPTPTACIARIFISWTAACPTTWACAACSTRWNSSKPCTTRACRRRSTTCAGSSSSSSIRCRRPPPTGTNRRRPPGTVDILLKATGVPIDHYSYEAVEQLKDIAARWRTDAGAPEPGRVLDQQGLAGLRRDTRPGGGDLRHRRVVCRAPRCEGARLPESAAHVLRPAARGGRPPARRGGDDHPGVARISAAAEGRWREQVARASARRCERAAPRAPDATRGDRSDGHRNRVDRARVRLRRRAASACSCEPCCPSIT